ncbi:MAG TPA: beta-galactosidase [Bryobacteraceae bacterium]|nr:beta-galactosidase [Bryobacteraceae bacterium]
MAVFGALAQDQGGWTAQPDWFPFEPENDFTGPSVIGMADWLDRPAGKHGFVQVRGDRLVFEDGTPVKFWGTNVCNARVGMPKEWADRYADKLAKYGINILRMHKFTWPGGREGIGDPADSLKLMEPLARNWDYFCAGLAKRGIYTAWSHIYGHRLTPADRDRVAAYDEIMNANLPWAHLRRSTIGLVNFARDLQDLSIGLTVNMLNRVNTVTGKRYAEDPSLAYIELQNEDDIFWGHTQVHLDRCPTYKRMFHSQFSEWLRKKYGTEAKLVAAWGEGALAPGESLEKGNIAAYANTEMSGQVLAAVRQGKTPPQRVLDNCAFLHEKQNEFYSRFVEAIRATGYRGAIVGSCWQAGSGISHYYNLLSDAKVGIVDRHNYSGGMRAMVSAPGSGIFGAGMQQVANRPFGISEWKSTLGNPWQAEAPAIIAAYGMGLQGWDLSCEFASDFDVLNAGLREYNVDAPADIGQYPVLSRMVLRGDVREGRVISTRSVALADLQSGRLGFQDQVRQRGDVKEFSGTVPPAALAVGRVVVDFVEKPTRTVPPDLSRYLDEQRKVVRSETGQLVWDYSDRGFFTINTAGTQGVVGFASGREHALSDVTITVETPFALVYVTSLDKTQPIAKAGSLLVQAIARTANTGMKVTAAGRVVERGNPPVLIEPVRATIKIRRSGRCEVHPLDHDGRRRPGTTPLAVNPSARLSEFQIDTGRDRAIYYLVEFKS